VFMPVTEPRTTDTATREITTVVLTRLHPDLALPGSDAWR
jgi:hypothetical protein